MVAPLGNHNRLGKYLKFMTVSSASLTPELSYILGALKGDAYFCGTKRAIALKATDASFVFEFGRCLKKQFGYRVSFYYRAYSNAFVVELHSKAIHDFLKDYDITSVRNTSSEEKSAFIRGFADSEGTVGQDLIEFSNCNRDTLILVKNLLSDLGIESHLYLHYKGTEIKENWSDNYRLSIMGNQNIFTFYQKIGFSIPRKMLKVQNKVYRKIYAT